MNPDLLAAIPLVCPACRGVVDGRYVDHPLRVAEAVETSGPASVRHGVLACPGCQARYPILDGIPIVLRDIGAWSRAALPDLALDRLPPSLVPLLLPDGGAGGVGSQGPIHRSIYATAQYADLLPPPPGAIPPFEEMRREALRFRIERVADAIERAPAAAAAADLGAATARLALECARRGVAAAAADLDPAALGIARRVAREGILEFARWDGGRRFRTVRVEVPALRTDRFLPVVADAQDPPFRPEAFGVAVLFDLLDNVRSPVTLVRQTHGMLRPGGRMLLSTPYHWLPEITPVAARLGDDNDAVGGADPGPRVLGRLLRGELAEAPEVHLAVEREDDVPLVLRRYDRGYDVFVCHHITARKAEAT